MITFRTMVLLLAIQLSALTARQVHAASVLDQIEEKDICSPTGGTISKERMARTLVKVGKIPAHFVDWDDQGALYEQYVQAVTVPLCDPPGSHGHADKCKGQDGFAQSSLVYELAHRLDFASRGGKGDFDLKLAKISLRFHRKREVTELDHRRYPITKIGNQSLASQLFIKDDELFEISCIKKELTGSSHKGDREIAVGPGGQDNKELADLGQGGSEKPSPNVLDALRVRAKPSDLLVGRDDRAFAAVSPASLSFSDDEIANKQTYNLHSTIGYVMPHVQSGSTTLTSIPFAKYDRDLINAAKAPPNSNVENFGVGVVEALNFNISKSLYANLVVAPQYVYSAVHGAEIYKVRAEFELQPLLPYLGYAARIPLTPLWGTAFLRGVYNGGSVMNGDEDPFFERTNDFSQAGFQIGGALFNSDVNSPFSGISIPVDFTWLHGFSGGLDHVKLFTVGINYTLPKTKYVTMGLSYTDGNNLDTFEEQQLWKASVGLKY